MTEKELQEYLKNPFVPSKGERIADVLNYMAYGPWRSLPYADTRRRRFDLQSEMLEEVIRHASVNVPGFKEALERSRAKGQ